MRGICWCAHTEPHRVTGSISDVRTRTIHPPLFAVIISAWTHPRSVEVIVVGFKLKCPMSGCSTELQAETKEELMAQGMAHAKTHGMAALSPDMMAKVQAAIKQT